MRRNTKTMYEWRKAYRDKEELMLERGFPEVSPHEFYCYDDKIEEINKTKCRTEFEKHYKREKALIEWIQANQIKILNSGIKTA